MPAFHECRVLLIFTLILAKNETAAAGFKASESLCLPQVDLQLASSLYYYLVILLRLLILIAYQKGTISYNYYSTNSRNAHVWSESHCYLPSVHKRYSAIYVGCQDLSEIF